LNEDSRKVPAPPESIPWREEPFRRLVESVTDYAIFLLDPDGRIASWNRGAQLLKGYRPEEIIGKHFSVFYPPSAVSRGWPEHELETTRRLGRFEDEGWRVRKDGSTFWASVALTAIRNDDGKLLGFSKITRDLSERQASEERLRLSEERFRLLIEGVQDYAIFLLDPTGHVASWNAGAQRIKGYRADEIIGRHFSTFYPQEALARDWPRRELEEATRIGRFEDEGWRLRKDGTRFWANVLITALRGADGKLRGFSKITRDLTEQRRQEQKLRDSEERFRLLLEGVQDYAILMLDVEGRVTSWNAGGLRILGYAADEILGQSFERFFPPEEVSAGKPAEELRAAIMHRRTEDRGWRVRKDGTRFWAEVIVTSLHDGEGRLRGFGKVVRDLSERKRMETLEEQGRHLTEFLAMLAHELRNPLAPIRNAIGIISMNQQLPPQVAWARDVLERQTMHLSRLVDDLLDVSRITRGKLRLATQPMDLATAVQRAIESTRPLLDARRHELHVSLPQEPLSVYGDLTRLTQVVLNLLNNAAKYTPEGGKVWIEAANMGDMVELRVRDTGVGIAGDMLDAVFDLFAQGERTIDRSEGGLGIGLTLARRIVSLHGGTISARSAGAGKGSEFLVRLPQLDVALAASISNSPGEFEMPVGGPSRSILVVDDNTDSAASMAILLRMAGHDVDVAHDGREAIQRIERKPADVVLLDIGLPGMNGYEVMKVLRARPEAAGMRVFAMTGFGQEEDRRRSLESGFDGHLVKPVLPAELFQAIAPPVEPATT